MRAVHAAFALATLAAARPAAADETPVARYRRLSVSMIMGMDLFATVAGPGGGWTGFDSQLGSNPAAAIVGLGASVRVVARGLVMGAELGVEYLNAQSSPATVVFPGFTLGYAIPIVDRVAFTPAFHSGFVVSSAAGSSVVAELLGEVGFEIFLGKHGFVEPVVSMGDYHNAANSADVFVFGVGYRLGVVF